MSNRALREWVTRLWATVRRRRSDADLEEELRLHLEWAAEDARRRGAPPGEASRVARLAAGGLTQAIEAQRAQRGVPWLDDLWRDVRFAARTLVRDRGFTVAAALSLALGIGANTAIFTLMDAVLFRSVPVERPGQLYFLGHDPGPVPDLSSNYPIFERYRAVPAFSGVTIYRSQSFRVSTFAQVERVAGQYVSGNYHAVLGVPMALGRGFAAESDRRPGASTLAVISYDYWMSHFGGAADVLSKTLIVDDRPMTIAGVTARGFHGLNAGEHLHVTLPMSVMALDDSRFFEATDGWIDLAIVGRLAPGASEAQALAATDAAFQQFLQEPANGWVRLGNRDRFRAAALFPAARGTFVMRQQYGQALWVLLAMVTLLLLVACANVGSLFLARAADRRAEIAVRLSLGASRSRVVRQLLTESIVLALLGGIAGVLIAVWGTGAILAVFASGPSPAVIDATLNGRVLVWTTVVVFLTAIAVGVAPALRSARVDLTPALKDGASAIHGRQRPALGRLLIAAQIALCLVLVTAAALLSRSLVNLHGFDAGFTRQHLLLADIDFSGAHLTGDARLRVFSDLVERMRRQPGMQSVSLSVRTPIDASSELRRTEVPGFEAHPRNGVSPNTVTPGYFRTFALKLTRGRDFSETDRLDTPPVAVVSEAMARHFFSGVDPIGRTFVMAPYTHEITIVGVVGDARHEELRSDAPARMVYLPLAQVSAGLTDKNAVPMQMVIALRASDDPGAVAASLRRELQSIDRNALLKYVRTMTQQIDAALIPERLLTRLSTWFAAIAVLLASVGLHGVMAYNVARRRREIGLRIALGASPRSILRRVLREASLVAVAGVAVGLPLALAAARLLTTFLFRLTAHDAATLVGTIAALMAVALLAGLLPARYAASIDPVEALRNR